MEGPARKGVVHESIVSCDGVSLDGWLFKILVECWKTEVIETAAKEVQLFLRPIDLLFLKASVRISVVRIGARSVMLTVWLKGVQDESHLRDIAQPGSHIVSSGLFVFWHPANQTCAYLGRRLLPPGSRAI